MTADCLEESLANAESFCRLAEPRYAQRVDKAILDGLRRFLKTAIPLQPPGYAVGVRYFAKASYRKFLGLWQEPDSALRESRDIARQALAELERADRPDN